MTLVAHIIFAIASLAFMFAAVVGRLLSRERSYPVLIQLSAVSTVGMLGTGTLLIVQSSAHLVPTCIKGLFYLGCLTAGYVLYRKLAVAHN